MSDSIEHSKYYYEYDRNDLNRENPFDNNINISEGTEKDWEEFWENDGSSLVGNIEGFNTSSSNEIDIKVPELPTTDNNNGRWKYDEDKIIKDITDYIGDTYRGHYTGKVNGFKEIQTIDLIAAKDLASAFCQSNILKYGSRYGTKDGKNKKDLLKVIHYAMLLLHFDDHYKVTTYNYNY